MRTFLAALLIVGGVFFIVSCIVGICFLAEWSLITLAWSVPVFIVLVAGFITLVDRIA